MIFQLEEIAEHRIQEHETIKCQIEDDADREIVEVKTKCENLLHEEQETNLKLREEVGVTKDKYHRWGKAPLS